MGVSMASSPRGRVVRANACSWSVWLSWLCALLPVGCAVDTRPASNGLVVQVDSNLSPPKDIDRLVIDATQDERALLHEEHALGAGALPLPSEFRVPYPGNSRPVSIHARAYKGSHGRIERSATTPIPAKRRALLRLPLDFLCDGTLDADGMSTCADGNTCIDGVCMTPALSEVDLPDYAAGSGKPKSDAGASAENCFDVSGCFASTSQAVELDGSCSFDVNPDLESAQLNVGFEFGFGGTGVCSANACYVPLDMGPGGWSFATGRITLPSLVCDKRAAGQALNVVVSNLCPAKTPGLPICGATGSTSDDVSGGGPDGTGPGSTISPPVFVGDACGGAKAQSCGKCGTAKRECGMDGRWSDFGACEGEGECEPNAVEPCGSGGMRVCMGDCRWGLCTGQACNGQARRACDRCGTQERSCDNGVWGEWSACMNQGVCDPNDTEPCGAGGLQACGGNCQWGACGDQACPGAPSQACGNCGMQTRSCDQISGQYSDFAACSDEGQCAPNQTMTCGRKGTQTCGGNCRWDSACVGQMCDGPATRACGNCGTQARTCDTTTGAWSDWGPCNGEGNCKPDQTRSCGSGGTQVCAGNCQWDSTCSGQSCSGSNQQPCGNCGTQRRSCDGNSGTWSAWSDCTGQGACQPNQVKACGSSGTQVCGANCQWGSACTDQVCDGATTQACGNCGVQTRTCDPTTGRLSAWSACMSQGACKPNATKACGSQGTQTCAANCQWASACTGQVCVEPKTQACGNCGTQTSTCDPNTGHASWSNCSGEGKCSPGDTQMCGSQGMRTCGNDCQWPSTCMKQVCQGDPPTRSCGNCGTQSSTCDTNSAAWNFVNTCSMQGACMPKSKRSCGPNGAGTQTCGDNCQWAGCVIACDAPPTQACGNCGLGTQASICDTSTGKVTWSGCMGGGACNPGDSQSCTNSSGQKGTRACAAGCQWPNTCDIKCSDPLSRSCGNCGLGTQTGTCDPQTGKVTYGDCKGGGVCNPGDSQPCTSDGVKGTQVCSNQCTWPTGANACVLACSEPLSRSCGNCGLGTQTGTCDPQTGKVTYGDCKGGGACKAGDSQPCMNGSAQGTETCTNQCAWPTGPNACVLACSDPLSRSCGNCGLGTQTGTCDPQTGKVTYGDCKGGGACKAGDSQPCTKGSAQGTQVCTNQCAWPSGPNACVLACSEPLSKACGNCGLGTQTGTCDPQSGKVVYGDCIGGGACAPGATQACGTDGTQTCGMDCKWPAACGCKGAAPAGPCGTCGTQSSTCNPMTGAWETTCVGGNVDLTSDPNNCRKCKNACSEGQACVDSTCTVPCGKGEQSCSGKCVSTTDHDHCGSCTTACAASQVCSANGTCAPCDGGQACSNVCVALDDPKNCGTCGNACVAPAACTQTRNAAGAVSYACAVADAGVVIR
jgi:hypothetical protein